MSNIIHNVLIIFISQRASECGLPQFLALKSW